MKRGEVMALQDFVPDISCFVALGPYNCVGNCSVHLNVNPTRRDGKKEDADFTLSCLPNTPYLILKAPLSTMNVVLVVMVGLEPSVPKQAAKPV